MVPVARYDGLAEWYDREFAPDQPSGPDHDIVVRLLDEGPGRLLDVGCGTGAHAAAMAERGWTVTGVDVSADMLRLARERGVEVIRADATNLPLDDAAFDAVVSIYTHTDVGDFGAVVREVARVLRPGGPFVYLGLHPCFCGPHSRFVHAEGVPVLHPGYWRTERYSDGPAVHPRGLRAKVGASHLPLGVFLQTFIEAGFVLEHVEEPRRREYPYQIALRARR